MDKLVDIKGFVEVFDISFYLFLGTLTLIFLILIFSSLKIYKYFKTKEQSSTKKAKEKLKNLDFTNPKKAAYTISKYAPILATNELRKDLLSELTQELSKYKYQKNVPNFTTKDREKFNIFLEVCNA